MITQKLNEHEIRLCECGCGCRAPIATYTNSKKGYKAGEPVRFIQGHYAKLKPPRFNNGFYRSGNRWKVRTRDGRFVYWYRIVYENYYLNGHELPEGVIIHHRDGNEANDKPDNLTLFCSGGAHMAFHRNGKKPVTIKKDNTILHFDSATSASIALGLNPHACSTAISKGVKARGWTIAFSKEEP